MKFLAVFFGLLAVAFGYQATWTINDLSEAIQSPNTDPAMLPYLNAALDQLMNDLVLGSDVNPQTTISTGAMDFTKWTLHELSEAIQDPTIDPVLKLYLEHALDTLMLNLFTGGSQSYIIVATPVGLLPIESAVTPVAVATPVAPEAAASAPLVQIIVKVNGQTVSAAQEPSVIVPEPVVLPAPVAPVVIPEPVVLPAPVSPVVVPEPVVLPAPVSPVVVPEAVVLPAPVLPEVVNPVDVIAVNPVSVVPVNPIDVIAVSPVDVNPVDIISPVPATAAAQEVGPIV